MDAEENKKEESEPIKESKGFEKRRERIKSWLKDPWNLALLGILIFAVGIRLYYFSLTLDQAVWWDEGEYMLRVNHLVLGTHQSGFFEGRELFTPYFWALIFFIFKSEVAIRFVQVVISSLTVFVVYFTGKEVYNKRVGIIAALFMSVFWLHLFFTCRLLTYLYAPLFYTLALALFWKGYYGESKHKDKYLYLSFITIIMGIGIYTSIAFSAFSILIFLLVTEQFNFLKNKRLWKYGLLSLPFLLFSIIPSYLVQGSLFPRLSQISDISATQTGAGVAGLFTYINMMPRLLLSVYLVLAILSLILFLRALFYLDLIIKSKSHGNVKKDLFIFLGALIPFAFYTWVSMIAGGPEGANYDAWILSVFPLLFCLMSAFIFEFKKIIDSKITSSQLRKVAFLLIIAILLFGAYQHIKDADQSIKNKLPSYYNLKPAGEWLKQNTQPGDIIATSAMTEITYYSQRESFALRSYENLTNFTQAVMEKRPKYIVITLWEWDKEWAYSLPQSGALNLTVAQAYFLDNEKTKPDTIIYKVNY